MNCPSPTFEGGPSLRHGSTFRRRSLGLSLNACLCTDSSDHTSRSEHGYSAEALDGGDEFVLIGAPTHTGLGADLERLRRASPREFERRFSSNVPAVAPRVLTCTARGGSLGLAREQLGRAISPIKKRDPAPSPEGVQHDLGLLAGG